MKLKLMMMIVAALVIAPVSETFAADAAAAETAKPKKKIKKQPKAYTKFDQAMKVAANNEEPVLALLYIDDNSNKASKQINDELRKSLFAWKPFVRDYANKNLVLLEMKAKPKKDGKLIDPKSIKTENERRFFENHGLDPQAALSAKRDGKTLDPLDLKNYPAIVCVKGDAENQELLFRMDKYDRDGGPGVWLSTLDALLRTKGIEPEVSADIQKILDDPTSVAKKKR